MFNVWYNLFTGSCQGNEKKNEKKPHPKTQTNIHWKLNSKNLVIAVK